MRISWRQRLQQQPRLREFAHWPVIPVDSVPRSRRKRFLRNQRIVAQVLNHTAHSTIARWHNVSPGRISQLLDRCLGGDEDAPPALTQALIPFQTVVDKQRAQPLPTMANQQGHACAFKALLKEVPGLRKGLDEMLLASLKDAAYAQRPTPEAFHGEFKRILTEAHWPRDQYPYTTDSHAYESVRRYLGRRSAELYQAKQLRQQPTARNLGVISKRYRALRAIQIDEHVLDLRGRVHLQLNDELIPLPIARANVLVAVDVDTDTVLGFHLAPTEHPNQQDLLTLINNCLQPWQPMELLTPGLSYAPGAAFPSGLDGAFPISFGTVQLDNALMHRAQSVIDLLCEQYGVTLSYSPPGMPKIRQLVESVFDYINRKCSHRVDSTTGSYPTDPNKESRKNQKKPPIITFRTIEEALSVILSENNITPKAALGAVAPLDLFQHHCATHFVRFVPKWLSAQWQPLIGSAVVTLHWYKYEKRQPHATFLYERYQGPGLLRIASEAKQIRVVYDYRDIRTLRAFTLDGEDLGEVYVSKPWRRFPHSPATRRWIHKNTKRYHLNSRDPLASYFRLLLENKGKTAMALSLLRVYCEFTGGQSDRLMLGSSDDPSAPLLSHKTQSWEWHPGIANHRG